VISNPDLVRFPRCPAQPARFLQPPDSPPAAGSARLPVLDICFLRDPIDRIRSIYTYFRQKPNPADAMSDLANRTALGDFIAGMIQDFPLFVKNVQVTCWPAPATPTNRSRAILDLATQRMLAASFLGVVDCFDQSVAAGAHALRCAFSELDWPPAGGQRFRRAAGHRCQPGREAPAACTPEVYESCCG